MKISIVILLGLFPFSSITWFDYVPAEIQLETTSIESGVIEQNESDSRQAIQRGMNQSRESRLYLQLDGLTEEQTARLDELNKKHQEEMVELRAQGRNNQISRANFRAQRTALFDRHQEELKEVLTKAQWDQLQDLRAERRTPPRSR